MAGTIAYASYLQTCDDQWALPNGGNFIFLLKLFKTLDVNLVRSKISI